MPGGRNRRGADGLGRQCAAIPLLRQDDALLVVLVTSRDTGRWVVPKGWHEAGVSGAEMAAREAFEEAGLVGRVQPTPLGAYRYHKRLASADPLLCEVAVFTMEVAELLETWPEQGQRRRHAFPPAEAAALVAEAELAALLLGLAGG